MNEWNSAQRRRLEVSEFSSLRCQPSCVVCHKGRTSIWGGWLTCYTDLPTFSLSNNCLANKDKSRLAVKDIREFSVDVPGRGVATDDVLRCIIGENSTSGARSDGASNLSGALPDNLRSSSVDRERLEGNCKKMQTWVKWSALSALGLLSANIKDRKSVV